MAKFVYEMQNILNIKYKLEDQAKQNYMAVQAKLNEATDYLNLLEQRMSDYMNQYIMLVSNELEILEIENCKNSIILMESYITEQKQVIHEIEQELERALIKLNEAMKERKIHEKLKEKQFERFKEELNQEEMKEIDELVSYRYNDTDSEDE
ncbi:MAG: flagellar export protein FliJ [Lachnospiraceae bacterium]